MAIMPALFIGHGSPMNTLERNDFTEAWRAMGAHLPKPRALLVVSAHWFFGALVLRRDRRYGHAPTPHHPRFLRIP